MVNGSTIADAIAHPQGLIARTLAANTGTDAMINTIYLSVLCRNPTSDEMSQAQAYFASAATPKEAAEDLMWALINSPGFLFNR
jgi:hypothetical protein